MTTRQLFKKLPEDEQNTLTGIADGTVTLAALTASVVAQLGGDAIAARRLEQIAVEYGASWKEALDNTRHGR
jgi:hypothetical protein